MNKKKKKGVKTKPNPASSPPLLQKWCIRLQKSAAACADAQFELEGRKKLQQLLLLRPFDSLPSTPQKPPLLLFFLSFYQKKQNKTSTPPPHLRRYSRPIVVTRVSGDLQALSGGVLPGRAGEARIGNQGPFTQVCESQAKSPAGPRQYSSMTGMWWGGGGGAKAYYGEDAPFRAQSPLTKFFVFFFSSFYHY